MSRIKHYIEEQKEGRFAYVWTPEELAEMQKRKEVNDAMQKYFHDNPNTWKVTHDIESTGNNHK